MKKWLKLITLMFAVIMITSCSSKQSKSVYEMTPKEALTWLEDNDIEIPEDLKHDKIGEYVVRIIQKHKEGRPVFTMAFNYVKTRDFIDSINKKLDELT